MAKKTKKNTTVASITSAQVVIPQGFAQPKLIVSKTMGELGLDETTLNNVLAAVSSSGQQVSSNNSGQQSADTRGIGTFKRFEPKSFQQLAESADGKIAITKETRDWEMGKKRHGTSTKIHVRTKYIDQAGALVYGYDLASFPAEKNIVETVANLLANVVNTI